MWGEIFVGLLDLKFLIWEATLDYSSTLKCNVKCLAFKSGQSTWCLHETTDPSTTLPTPTWRRPSVDECRVRLNEAWAPFTLKQGTTQENVKVPTSCVAIVEIPNKNYNTRCGQSLDSEEDIRQWKSVCSNVFRLVEHAPPKNNDVDGLKWVIKAVIQTVIPINQIEEKWHNALHWKGNLKLPFPRECIFQNMETEKRPVNSQWAKTK